ncbi:MAG: hypothetical protein VX113_05640 [Pseudomonadota bacterium]|nr:hypothetical protein [Pseudomonadota bacterium]
MTAWRHMTGRIGGLAAIILQGAAILAAPAAGAAEAPAKALAGVDVSRLIMERLAREGLEGAPSIKPDRIFPNCDSTPDIEPMFGGWSTVAVHCISDSGWRFMIRTNLTSRAAPVPIRDFRPLAVGTPNGRNGPLNWLWRVPKWPRLSLTRLRLWPLREACRATI